jgi:hypothetical protein
MKKRGIFIIEFLVPLGPARKTETPKNASKQTPSIRGRFLRLLLINLSILFARLTSSYLWPTFASVAVVLMVAI